MDFATNVRSRFRGIYRMQDPLVLGLGNIFKNKNINVF
jgi:hypothetical protein